MGFSRKTKGNSSTTMGSCHCQTLWKCKSALDSSSRCAIPYINYNLPKSISIYNIWFLTQQLDHMANGWFKKQDRIFCVNFQKLLNSTMPAMRITIWWHNIFTSVTPKVQRKKKDSKFCFNKYNNHVLNCLFAEEKAHSMRWCPGLVGRKIQCLIDYTNYEQINTSHCYMDHGLGSINHHGI